MKKKKKSPKLKLKKQSPPYLKNSILRVLGSKKRLNAKQLGRILKVSNTVDSIKFALASLEKEGLIRHVKEGKYNLIKGATNISGTSNNSRKKSNKLTGKVDLIRSGAAYIVSDDYDTDIYVPGKKLKGALDGDIVQVEIIHNPRRTKQEGKVTAIIKRATSHILGILRDDRKYASVYSTDPKKNIIVHVKQDDKKEAEDGDHVVVKITDYGNSQNKAYWGEVMTVVASKNPSDLAMQSILVNNGFNLEFPPDVLEETKALELIIDDKLVEERRDFREITTFTIDPLTARDFDDALSVEYMADDVIEIGIHIADVTHYVPSDSALDKEALERSTSVYLVDRVLPMLPEKLSNNLCSLVPDEDRLTFSAVFTFDKELNITKQWFGKTIIHSDRRFTYEEAQEIIETKEGDFSKEVLELDRIAIHLRKLKYKGGAISFESPEMQFELDAEGKPIGIFQKERKDAHLLVEDFMLLANKEVATFMGKKRKGGEVPFVYRVHDLPNQEKLGDFAAFAAELGFKMNISSPNQIVKSFNLLTKAAKDNPELALLEPLAIRTMAKAIYTSENIGHYGLGFDYYTHFTSPIRRYADVLVHRILEKNLLTNQRESKDQLEARCKHISAQERKAMDAERESVKYKQVEYLVGREGEVFDAFVSGMIDRGIFIQLVESGTEGLVSFDNFPEPYSIDGGRLKAKAARSGKVIKLGDRVKVKLLSIDLEKRQVELEVLID